MEYTQIPEPLSDSVNNDAGAFVSNIFELARKNILYGDVIFEFSKATPRPIVPDSFIALAYIAFQNKMHIDYYLKNAIKIVFFEHQVINIQKFINDFIYSLHKCINLVETKLEEEDGHIELNRVMQKKNPFLVYLEVQDGSTFNYTPSQSTWKTYTTEWRLAADQWKEYLDLFNDIYPCVFHNCLHVIALVIDRFPTLFWQKFWEYIYCNLPGSDFCHLLVYTIAPQLINSNPAEQHQYCSDALRDLIRLNDFHGRLTRPTPNDMLDEALIQTGMILQPHPDSLGEDTRSGMRMDGYGGPYPLYF